MDFSGKVALVTGGSRSIGAAIARELAAGGATIAINYRSNTAAAESVADEIRGNGGTCNIFQADVSDTDQAAELVKQVQKDLGGLDILVNNAGIVKDTLLMTMKEEQWDAVIDTNLKSIYAVTRPAVRGMMKKRWGRIINITSIVGQVGQVGQTNYAASKAGVIGFSKSLAREIASRNITVNAVAPGYIPTDINAEMATEFTDLAVEHTPLGRPGTPEEVAWAVAFLAAERSGFITGHVLSVNGGMAMV